MSGQKRSLVIIGTTISFASAGFALGVLAQVGSMIPELAGGGHGATGRKHSNFVILGSLVGAALGLLVGWWRWRRMCKRVD